MSCAELCITIRPWYYHRHFSERANVLAKTLINALLLHMRVQLHAIANCTCLLKEVVSRSIFVILYLASSLGEFFKS